MDELVPLSRTPGLQALIERASSALAAAKTSAEVLEASNLARTAHDVATAAHRLAKAKNAQDDVLTTIRQTQRDALLIECSAMALFADEYDGAVERGEVRGRGRPPKNVPDENIIPTAASLGVSRKDILQARRVRDFDKEETGGVEQALDAMMAGGVEPTRARLRRLLKPPAGAAGRARGRPRSPARGTHPSLLGLLKALSEFDAVEAAADLGPDAVAGELLMAIQRAEANLDRLRAALCKVEEGQARPAQTMPSLSGAMS